MKKGNNDSNLLIMVCAVTAVLAAVLITAGILLGSGRETKVSPVTQNTADEAEPVSYTTEAVTEDVTDTAPAEKETKADTVISTETSDTSAETAAAVPETETYTEPDTAAVSEEASSSGETSSSAENTPVPAAETSLTETETSAAASTEPAPAPAGTYDRAFFANDLFIGDSIYTGLYLYDFFPQDQVFAKVGLNPESARTAEISGTTAAGKAEAMKPSRIFIMLGSNGLAYMSASGMANNLKALVGELKEASPDSKVYIVSIPPVTRAHELEGQETMAMVNSYNSLLVSAAPECGAVYLDLCSELENADGYFSSAYAEADGLHFLGAAYKKMLSFFQKSIQ